MIVYTEDGKHLEPGMEVHFFRFLYDGGVIYDLCKITHLVDSGPNRFAFKPVTKPSSYTGYVNAGEVDVKATMGKTVTCVLTEPDFDKAKTLAMDAMKVSLRRKEMELQRLKEHADILAGAEL